MADQLMDINAVMEMVSLRRTMIYGLISKNRFPQPVKLSSRCVRWRRTDLDAWIDGLPDKNIAA